VNRTVSISLENQNAGTGVLFRIILDNYSVTDPVRQV